MDDRRDDNDEPERKGRTTYAFPSRCRCENAACRSLRTVAVSVQGRIQYRRCNRCGWTFKVMGWEV